MSRPLRWFLSALIGSTFAVQVQAQDPHPEDPPPVEEAMPVEDAEAADAATDLVSALDADGRFTVLLGALQSTNLVETLQGEGPFTLFAPTDEAFAALPEGTLEVLTPEQLQAVLLYHVSGEGIDGESVEMGEPLLTVGGGTLQLAATEDGLTVNDALVSESVEASNGQIYVLDTVLMPPPGEDESPGDGSDSESEPDDGP